MNASNEGHGIDVYNQHVRFQAIPFPVTLPGNQSFYQQPKTSINSESGLTSNIPFSRKRSRDSGDEFYANVPSSSSLKKRNIYGGSQLFGENVMQPQIQPYQLEIDTIICEHTKKIILELQQRQKQNAKVLVAAIGESMIKAVRDKDDQIQEMARLNVMLQQKVKGLYMENNLWRELAQTNEAAANSLHTDLQRSLAQFEDRGNAATTKEIVESCGSNDNERNIDSENMSCYVDKRLCRNCSERQCCVLLLPCRHLCLCNICGSGSHQLQSCPICNSRMTITLHVNMS